MAITDANLYFSGGTMSPMSRDPNDWFDCEKKDVQSSGLGTRHEYTFGISDVMKDNMWPAKEIGEEDNKSYAIDCIRGATEFVINRHLDFRFPHLNEFRMDKGHKKQLWLYKWFKTEFNQIDEGINLWMVHIPPKLLVKGLAWDVSVPVDGITFSIVEKFSGAVLAEGINGGEEACALLSESVLSEELKFSPKKNRIFGIRIDTLPEANEDQCCGDKGCGKLDGFAVQLSVRGSCLFQGY